jgi:hypothetical protein
VGYKGLKFGDKWSAAGLRDFTARTQHGSVLQSLSSRYHRFAMYFGFLLFYILELSYEWAALIYGEV